MTSPAPHPAFPDVPLLEQVGPLAGRRFMESFNDVTLRGMARGAAGEPPNVVLLAKTILAERHGASPPVDPARALLRRREFAKLCELSRSENKAERDAARYRLKTEFDHSVP
jgi:hypothetical protein